MTCFKRRCFAVILALLAIGPAAWGADNVLKIMPLGDSNTRGTYPRGAGPNSAEEGAGGYRYPLQQMLTAGGYQFDFVGSQTSNAVGESGLSTWPSSQWIYDPTFDRDHHGCAGFSNNMLITGGTVPTLVGDPINAAPPLVDCLTMYQPDIVLLMSGTNFSWATKSVAENLTSLDAVIRTITANSPNTWVLVSTIYDRWDTDAARLGTDAYNAGIPDLVLAAQERGERVAFVDAGAALSRDDFLRADGTMGDGIHPRAVNSGKPAAVWYEAIQAVAPTPAPEPGTMVLLSLGGASWLCRKQFLRRRLLPSKTR